MKARRVLGWLLLLFAALLTCSQTVGVVHLAEHQVEGFDFPRRYASESSIENYGIALAALVVGILVSRSPAKGRAIAAFAVVFVALWFLVGQELWLHYFELPRKYPRFADNHPYFTGELWMITPRFLWHLILPVAALLSARHVFSSLRKRDA